MRSWLLIWSLGGVGLNLLQRTIEGLVFIRYSSRLVMERLISALRLGKSLTKQTS